MQKHASFTVLCGRLAGLGRRPRADLHVHTRASDGAYTPSQVVALSRQAGLCAVAVTDHDTLAGIPEAQLAARGHIELVPGVEISTGYEGRELHLLGYFIRTDHDDLNTALAMVSDSRRERFRTLVELLRGRGAVVPEERMRAVEQSSPSLGRRHAAGLLVACGYARSIAEATYRFVNPLLPAAPPKKLLPIAEAISLVRAAGGVASLAHPSPELTDPDFERLRALGLQALEAEYPWGRNSGAHRVHAAAARFRLAISGGSDCHGPDPAHRRIGSHFITSDELTALRGCAASADR